MTCLKRLPVPGLCNCRDLGGYAAAGGTTRYGVFLRSEAPCGIDAAAVSCLRGYGLTATMDLRGEEETRWRPSDLRTVFPYYHRPLSGGAETFDPGNLPEGPFSWDKIYIRRAETHKDWIRTCVTDLAQARGCVLFHCTTGKDRTGILACCLLGAVGVSREDIAADYCLSQVYLQPVFQAMRTGALTIRPGPSHFEEYVFQTPFTAMEKLYDHLTGRYGSVAGYLLDAGVSPAVLDRLKEKLVLPA